jgi:hypothetical protein
MKNYIYHGTRNLIALPGRAVQTFPSGLVRIDRTYACRAGDEGRYRRDFEVGNPLPFDDGSPSIDQLSIFPEPKEEQGDNGFVRFSVSAYGRVNTTGTVEKHFQEGQSPIRNFFLQQGSTDIPDESSFPFLGGTIFQEPCVNEVATFRYVVNNSSDPIDSLPKDIPLRVFVRRDGKLVPIESVYRPGISFFEGSGTTSFRRITTLKIDNIVEDSPGTVFGAWKEMVYTMRASARVAIFTRAE